MTKALVVLSGGQDSTTCLFWAVERYGAKNVHAVTYDYGQRHIRELEAARKVADLSGCLYHEFTQVGPILKGRSPLTNPSLPLEQYENHAQMEQVIGERVEVTFVPMRNALFLTLAANYAAVKDISHIVTGVCQADNANYPDCRQVFINDMEAAINTALGNEDFDKGPWLSIHTPLMNLTKDQSIKLALGIPGCYEALAYSHTAYDGAYPPTGKDHATVLRAHGFEVAGVPDPLILRAIAEGKMDWPDAPNYSILAVHEVLEKLTLGITCPYNWVSRS